jgi:hypothetical protein
MARFNQNQQNNQPWLVPDIFVVPREVHDMPKHPKKVFPIFNPDKKDYVEDNIKKFMLVVRLTNVQYEDVVCILFPYTFENRAST